MADSAAALPQVGPPQLGDVHPNKIGVIGLVIIVLFAIIVLDLPMLSSYNYQLRYFLTLMPLLAVLGAAAWWAFEAGQAVTEKQRLRDVAEAAALSGAVWQARSLNFAAAMNRAVIANEAVIAQSVSLRSFSSYLNVLLPRAAAVTQWVPLLDAAMATLAQSWAQVDQVVRDRSTLRGRRLGRTDVEASVDLCRIHID